MEDTSQENDISPELIEEELKTLVGFIERHHRWSKIQHNASVDRLNTIVTESLLETAEFIRTLCAKLSAGDND
jgi:hypothetical protein